MISLPAARTGKPPGAEFTDDVSAYENMKLSLLNASHSLLSYPAFLAGSAGWTRR